MNPGTQLSANLVTKTLPIDFKLIRFMPYNLTTDIVGGAIVIRIALFGMSSYRGTKFTHAPLKPLRTQRTHAMTTHLVTALPLCLRRHTVSGSLNYTAAPATAAYTMLPFRFASFPNQKKKMLCSMTARCLTWTRAMLKVSLANESGSSALRDACRQLTTNDTQRC